MYAMGDFEHALVSYHKANSVTNLLMKEREEMGKTQVVKESVIPMVQQYKI